VVAVVVSVGEAAEEVVACWAAAVDGGADEDDDVPLSHPAATARQIAAATPTTARRGRGRSAMRSTIAPGL
jgi:hypothetical protein